MMKKNTVFALLTSFILHFLVFLGVALLAGLAVSQDSKRSAFSAHETIVDLSDKEFDRSDAESASQKDSSVDSSVAVTQQTNSDMASDQVSLTEEEVEALLQGVNVRLEKAKLAEDYRMVLYHLRESYRQMDLKSQKIVQRKLARQNWLDDLRARAGSVNPKDIRKLANLQKDFREKVRDNVILLDPTLQKYDGIPLLNEYREAYTLPEIMALSNQVLRIERGMRDRVGVVKCYWRSFYQLQTVTNQDFEIESAVP